LKTGGAEEASLVAPSILADRDFIRLWIVGLAMFSVRWIEALAISVFVYRRTGSEFLVASMMMWRVLPMFLLGAFAGAWSEMVERYSALLAMLVGSLATSLAIGVLALTGHLEIWHLGAASFINGIAWATDSPVRRYMLGQVVGTHRLGTAMAVDVGTNNASRMLGPTLGGVLIASFGIEGAFLFSVLIYVIGIAAALGVRYRNRPRESGPFNVLRYIADGWQEVCTNDRLRGVFVITFLFNIFGWPTLSMVPVIGGTTLGLSSDLVGVLTSADGAGTLAGALLIGWFGRPRRFGRLYVAGSALFSAAMVVVAITGVPALAGGLLIAVGIGGAGVSIMQSTLAFLATPVPLRGTVFGLLTVCIGISPLGLTVLGLLAEAVGAANAMLAFSILGLIAIAATVTVWRPVWLSNWATA
jgi:MFS family permease